MKKFAPLAFVLALALFFPLFLFSLSNPADQAAPQPSISSPANPNPPQLPAPAQTPLAPLAVAPPFKSAAPSVLRTTSSGELFDQLFPVQRWSHWPEREVLNQVRARFRQPYPAPKKNHHKGAFEREILSRIGILKALGRGLKTPGAQSFFRAVAKNPRETMLVRRQALENLRPALVGYNDSQRSDLLKGLPPLLLSLAGSSEKELLTEAEADARQPNRSRHTANQAEAASLNRWENIPCPSPEKFRELAREVNWQGEMEYTCDLSMLGKLGRSLLLLSNLRLNFAEESTVAANLREPFTYVAKRSRTLKLDLNQRDSIAYNKPSLAEINLGPVFFTEDPLDSVGVLIHEARHSDEGEDQGHMACVQGDIPQMVGGCDRELTDEKHAGAYSYGVFYNLSLARSPVVSPADREYLESDALLRLSTRFNRLLPRFAHFKDLIAGLSDEGELVVLHPFLNRALPAAGVNASERFQRINYEDRSGGLYLLDGKSAGRSWRHGEKPSPFYPKEVAASLVNTFIGKFRLHYQPYPYTTFVDDKNNLHYLDHDEEGIRRAFKHPLKPPGPVKSLLLGAFEISYLLTAEGSIFRLRQWGNDKDYNLLHENEAPFLQGTGGVLKDTLFLITKGGRLLQQEQKEVFREGSFADYGEIVSVLHPVAFQAPRPAVQYEEGRDLRVLLDDSGDLWLGAHGDNAPSSHIPGHKLQSFAIMKVMETSLVKAEEPNLSAFQKNCGVKDAVVEPWLRRGVGLSDGRLIFEGTDGACWPADLPGLQGKIRAFSIGSGVFGEWNKASYFFAPSELTLTLSDGRQKIIHPYLVQGL